MKISRNNEQDSKIYSPIFKGVRSFIPIKSKSALLCKRILTISLLPLMQALNNLFIYLLQKT